jgi:hypothetical protein
LLTPTSIAYTGTSASIGANGSVDFTACSSLSLNGVFFADYDNYMVVARAVGTTGGTGVSTRLRNSGTDASATNYTFQFLLAQSTTILAGRYGSYAQAETFGISSSQRDGVNVTFYGPYLAQPTAARSVTMYGSGNASVYDNAWTHSLSSSYDGFTFIPNSGSMTGLVSVYGLVGS